MGIILIKFYYFLPLFAANNLPQILFVSTDCPDTEIPELWKEENKIAKKKYTFTGTKKSLTVSQAIITFFGAIVIVVETCVKWYINDINQAFWPLSDPKCSITLPGDTENSVTISCTGEYFWQLFWLEIILDTVDCFFIGIWTAYVLQQGSKILQFAKSKYGVNLIYPTFIVVIIVVCLTVIMVSLIHLASDVKYLALPISILSSILIALFIFVIAGNIIKLLLN